MAPDDKKKLNLKELDTLNINGDEVDDPDEISLLGLSSEYSIFESTPFAVIVTDQYAKIGYLNKQAESMFGYHLEEILGDKIELLVPDDLKAKHVEYRTGFKDKPFARPMGIGMNLKGRRKNGEVFPVEIGINYLNRRGQFRIFCFVTDITLRLQFEDLQIQQNEFLSALHETSLLILSRLDLDRVLEAIMTKAAALLECHHGEIVLVNKTDGIMESRVAFGAFKSRVGTRQKINGGFLSKVIDKAQPVIENLSITGTPQEVAFPDEVNCLMGVPLENNNGINGIICIAGEKETKKFSNDLALDMLQYFGKLASIAIENAQLFAEVEASRVRAEQQTIRMERELEYARTVQVALLPQKIPVVDGWSFAVRWKPAREVAGDYYDFIVRNDNYFDLLIADVTDKGVPAALFMAHSKTLTRTALETSRTLLEGVTQANQAITQENVGPYVTMFLTRINAITGEGCYINAGHESTLFYHKESDQITEWTQTGLPLGIDQNITYEHKLININYDDFIVMYTDGVTEAMNREFQQFGLDALKKAVYSYRNEPAEEIASRLLKDVETFIGSTDPSDDLAILVARRLRPS